MPYIFKIKNHLSKDIKLIVYVGTIFSSQKLVWFYFCYWDVVKTNTYKTQIMFSKTIFLSNFIFRKR